MLRLRSSGTAARVGLVPQSLSASAVHVVLPVSSAIGTGLLSLLPIESDAPFLGPRNGAARAFATRASGATKAGGKETAKDAAPKVAQEESAAETAATDSGAPTKKAAAARKLPVGQAALDQLASFASSSPAASPELAKQARHLLVDLGAAMLVEWAGKGSKKLAVASGNKLAAALLSVPGATQEVGRRFSQHLISSASSSAEKEQQQQQAEVLLQITDRILTESPSSPAFGAAVVTEAVILKAAELAFAASPPPRGHPTAEGAVADAEASAAASLTCARAAAMVIQRRSIPAANPLLDHIDASSPSFSEDEGKGLAAIFNSFWLPALLAAAQRASGAVQQQLHSAAATSEAGGGGVGDVDPNEAFRREFSGIIEALLDRQSMSSASHPLASSSSTSTSTTTAAEAEQRKAADVANAAVLALQCCAFAVRADTVVAQAQQLSSTSTVHSSSTSSPSLLELDQERKAFQRRVLLRRLTRLVTDSSSIAAAASATALLHAQHVVSSLALATAAHCKTAAAASGSIIKVSDAAVALDTLTATHLALLESITTSNPASASLFISTSVPQVTQAYRAFATLLCGQQKARSAFACVGHLREWAESVAQHHQAASQQHHQRAKTPFSSTAAVLGQPSAVEALCILIRSFSNRADDIAFMLKTHPGSALPESAHLVVPDREAILLGGTRASDLKRRDLIRRIRRAQLEASTLLKLEAPAAAAAAALPPAAAAVTSESSAATNNSAKATTKGSVAAEEDDEETASLLAATAVGASSVSSSSSSSSSALELSHPVGNSILTSDALVAGAFSQFPPVSTVVALAPEAAAKPSAAVLNTLASALVPKNATSIQDLSLDVQALLAPTKEEQKQIDLRERESGAIQPLLKAFATIASLPQPVLSSPSASPSSAPSSPEAASSSSSVPPALPPLSHFYDACLTMAIRTGSVAAVASLLREIAARGLSITPQGGLADLVRASQFSKFASRLAHQRGTGGAGTERASLRGGAAFKHRPSSAPPSIAARSAAGGSSVVGVVPHRPNRGPSERVWPSLPKEAKEKAQERAVMAEEAKATAAAISQAAKNRFQQNRRAHFGTNPNPRASSESRSFSSAKNNKNSKAFARAFSTSAAEATEGSADAASEAESVDASVLESASNTADASARRNLRASHAVFHLARNHVGADWKALIALARSSPLASPFSLPAERAVATGRVWSETWDSRRAGGSINSTATAANTAKTTASSSYRGEVIDPFRTLVSSVVSPTATAVPEWETTKAFVYAAGTALEVPHLAFTSPQWASLLSAALRLTVLPASALVDGVALKAASEGLAAKEALARQLAEAASSGGLAATTASPAPSASVPDSFFGPSIVQSSASSSVEGGGSSESVEWNKALEQAYAFLAANPGGASGGAAAASRSKRTSKVTAEPAKEAESAAAATMPAETAPAPAAGANSNNNQVLVRVTGELMAALPSFGALPAPAPSSEPATFTRYFSSLAVAGGRIRHQIHSSYSPLIQGALQAGNLRLAFETFDGLQEVLASVAASIQQQAVACSSSPSVPMPDFSWLAKPRKHAYSDLIEGCGALGQPNRAVKILERMQQDLRGSGSSGTGSAAGGDDHAALAGGESITSLTAPSRHAYSAVISAYCRAGKSDKALHILQDACNSGVAMPSSAFSALIGAFADEGKPRAAIRMLREAQLQGQLAEVDASASRGIWNVSGLPLSAISVILYDGLRALRRAVKAGAIQPPQSVRIYHSPSTRIHIRGILQSLSPACDARTQGLSHLQRHLMVDRETLMAFLTAPADDEDAGNDDDLFSLVATNDRQAAKKNSKKAETEEAAWRAAAREAIAAFDAAPSSDAADREKTRERVRAQAAYLSFTMVSPFKRAQDSPLASALQASTQRKRKARLGSAFSAPAPAASGLPSTGAANVVAAEWTESKAADRSAGEAATDAGEGSDILRSAFSLSSPSSSSSSMAAADNEAEEELLEWGQSIALNKQKEARAARDKREKEGRHGGKPASSSAAKKSKAAATPPLSKKQLPVNEEAEATSPSLVPSQPSAAPASHSSSALDELAQKFGDLGPGAGHQKRQGRAFEQEQQADEGADDDEEGDGDGFLPKGVQRKAGASSPASATASKTSRLAFKKLGGSNANTRRDDEGGREQRGQGEKRKPQAKRRAGAEEAEVVELK